MIYNRLGLDILQSNLCAQSALGDTCTGDSGGGVFLTSQGSVLVSG